MNVKRCDLRVMEKNPFYKTGGRGVTKKELKRLSRTDLLELLLQERQENETLHAEIKCLKEQLADRIITIQNSGSIAEASLQLNGIFDMAQRAAEQYLENIRLLSGKQEEICEQMEAKTAEKCSASEMDTKKRCEATTRKADEESSTCWNKVSKDLDEFYQLRGEYREMISDKSPGRDKNDA